jgi:hypothetical protein
LIPDNVLRVAAGGGIEFLSARTVAKFINKSSLLRTIAQQRIFSPALQHNSEQKVDEMHVSPS